MADALPFEPTDGAGYAEAVEMNRQDMLEVQSRERERDRELHGCNEDCYPRWAGDPAEDQRAAVAHSSHIERDLAVEEYLEQAREESHHEEFPEGRGTVDHAKQVASRDDHSASRTPGPTLNIVHDGQLYRSDKQTAELLRQVQHWQAGGDRTLETALFDHGLTSGRIQPGPVAREQTETADARYKMPGLKEEPTHAAAPLHEGLTTRVSHAITNRVQDIKADVDRLRGTEPGTWDQPVVVTHQDGTREVMTVSNRFDMERSGKRTVAEAREWMRTPMSSEHSWLTRAADTARAILRRADQVVERWLPSPADTHFKQGSTIAFRDQSTNTTRMAHITEARNTRVLDVKGWLPTQVVTIRQEDGNGLAHRRELTPRELRSATMLKSSSAGQASGVPERREKEARNQPVRQAVDPPLRQPGSAWNITVQPAWPAITARDRAPTEQRATIAWQVNQPAPLAFHATQRRGLEQGQG